MTKDVPGMKGNRSRNESGEAYALFAKTYKSNENVFRTFFSEVVDKALSNK